MKTKSNFILLCAATALMSCSQSYTDEMSVDRTKGDFVAVAEQFAQVDQPVSRTTMDENRNVIWTDDDRVSIFFGSTANLQYKVTAGADTTSATFTSVPSSDFVSGNELSLNLAYYPYQSTISYLAGSGGSHTLSVTIPTEQTYTANSFGEGTNAMVAITSAASDKVLNFKNVMGALKLQLKGTATITKVEIEGNGGEKLSSAAVVTPVYGDVPTVAMSSTALTKATLRCGTGVALNTTTATPFYVMLPPTTFSTGFAITITDSEGKTMTKSTSNAITITRSIIKPMAAFTYEGSGGGNIDFGDDEEIKNVLADLTVDGDAGSSKIDADGDGEISYQEAQAVTTIVIGTESLASATSLTGIEYFTNLTSLVCKGTEENKGGLTSLDLSANLKLTSLDCSYNNLTSLLLPPSSSSSPYRYAPDNTTDGASWQSTVPTVLRAAAATDQTLTIDCSNNNLTTLDVSGCTALTELDCYYNRLTTLDLSHNPNLIYLSCHFNQLTELNVTNCTAMEEIGCFNNQLTSLDLSDCTALTGLGCSDNNLQSLNVDNCTLLEELYCNTNSLTQLNLSNNTNLQYLRCKENNLTSIDVSKLTRLVDLICNGNSIASLDVTKNSALSLLICYENKIKTLDLSANTELTQLSCFDNLLTGLNTANCTKLTIMGCGNNLITSIDVSNNTALTELYCDYNCLTALDVSTLTALTYLMCNDNNITALDVSHNSALTELYCDTNYLTSLNLGTLSALTWVDCYDNNLTSIDVSHNSALVGMDCSPMNDADGNNLLATLYIAQGQVVDYINGIGDYVRNNDYIPAATNIVEGDGTGGGTEGIGDGGNFGWQAPVRTTVGKTRADGKTRIIGTYLRSAMRLMNDTNE